MIYNPPLVSPVGEFTDGSIGNLDNFDFQNRSVIRFTNGSLATLRGLKAGSPGQQVIIVAAGAQVDLAHQNAGSSAANRLINTVTSNVTSLAASKGSAIYEYDVTNSRWRLVNHVQGASIAIPFNAANFTANGAMTFTVASGDVQENSYYLKDNLLHYVLNLSGSTIGGTPNSEIRSATPYLWNITNSIPIQVLSTGLPTIISVGGPVSSQNYVRAFSDLNGANWGVGANTIFRGNWIFPVQ